MPNIIRTTGGKRNISIIQKKEERIGKRHILWLIGKEYELHKHDLKMIIGHNAKIVQEEIYKSIVRRGKPTIMDKKW